MGATMDRIDLKTQKVSYLLEKEIELHRLLIECLEQEYKHMIQLSVLELDACVQSKEAILDEIWNHESLLSQETGFMKLNEFMVGLNLEAQQLLRDPAQTLLLLIGDAQSLNRRNALFAEGSLLRIDEMKKNVLGISSNTSKENYSNSGLQNPINEQGGRLLSTEA